MVPDDDSEGGGRVGRFFTEELLEHWLQLPVVIEEYPYVGMDFQGDPEMPRPPSQPWGPASMYA